MRALFSGMEWLPDCLDGGLDRYYFEQLHTLAAVGVSGMAIASSAATGAVGAIQVRGMARKNASLFSRWRGARRLAGSAISDGIDLVNSHFALYAFAWLDRIPRDVP